MYGLTDKSYNELLQILASMPEIEEVVLYGSRARGDYWRASDVDLSINQFGDNLMIECTNHFSGTLIKSNGQFLTTKSTDKMLHGLGLESVRQTAAKLHGFVKIQDTHDTFTINVCLPNIMPKQQS